MNEIPHPISYPRCAGIPGTVGRAFNVGYILTGGIMLTYQNISKKQAIADAKAHIKQDRLARGFFYRNGSPDWRGCSIGCDVKTENSPHSKWAELFGTPPEIPRLIDFLFESLPKDKYINWHLRVRQAIPAGVDLSKVGPLHAARCLRRCIGYIGKGNEQWRLDCHNAISKSATILETGRYLTSNEATGAAEAAEAARAAEAAEAVWAAEATRAARAAWAAGAAEAAWAARAAEITQQANDLIELLKAAK